MSEWEGLGPELAGRDRNTFSSGANVAEGFNDGREAAISFHNSDNSSGDVIPHCTSMKSYQKNSEQQNRSSVEKLTHGCCCHTSSVRTRTAPSIITLNVGGTLYTTLLSTLTKCADSMLSAMFSGRHNLHTDDSGAYFIDRNGQYFGYILDFLRAEILPPNSVAVGVLTEARYFGLWELESRLSILPSISSLIVKENHRSQFPNYSEVKRRIVRIAMENATVSKTGEVLIYAFRQRFVPKAPNFDINHSCVADQAHISIGPWESVADEETLIKCIESDLLEENFTVTLHDGKRRCKYFYGQSCQKCVFRIQIEFA